MAGKSHSPSPVLLFDSVETWEATEQAPRGQLQLRRHSGRAGAAHRGIANNLPDRGIRPGNAPISISVQDACGEGSLHLPLIPSWYFLSLLRAKEPEGRRARSGAATRSHPSTYPVTMAPGRMLLHSPGLSLSGDGLS